MKAAVMGYGTIGSGVVEVLDINGSSIAKRVGEPVEIKYVLDLRDFREIRSRIRSYTTIRRLQKILR